MDFPETTHIAVLSREVYTNVYGNKKLIDFPVVH